MDEISLFSPFYINRRTIISSIKNNINVLVSHLFRCSEFFLRYHHVLLLRSTVQASPSPGQKSFQRTSHVESEHFSTKHHHIQEDVHRVHSQ